MTKAAPSFDHSARELETTTLSEELLQPSRVKNYDLHSNGLHADECIREQSTKLVHSVFLSKLEEGPRTVVFAGVDSGSGCSEICTRTAEVLARNVLGTVCLVDGNLRSPCLQNFFDIHNRRGLIDSILDNRPIRLYTQRVDDGNLWVVPAGSVSRDSGDAVNVERLRRRIVELREEFDYVVIDGPPLDVCADTLGLAQASDGLVMVLEANSTRKDAAAKAVAGLRECQIPVLGAVLNKRTFPIPSRLYKHL